METSLLLESRCTDYPLIVFLVAKGRVIPKDVVWTADQDRGLARSAAVDGLPTAVPQAFQNGYAVRKDLAAGVCQQRALPGH